MIPYFVTTFHTCNVMSNSHIGHLWECIFFIDANLLINYKPLPYLRNRDPHCQSIPQVLTCHHSQFDTSQLGSTTRRELLVWVKNDQKGVSIVLWLSARSCWMCVIGRQHWWKPWRNMLFFLSPVPNCCCHCLLVILYLRRLATGTWSRIQTYVEGLN